jgi:ketosteroid isomerase-like protein
MKKKRNRGVHFFVLHLLLLAALSCSPKPTDIVKSYQEAYNNHDLESLLALYDEDVSFEIVGEISLQGKEQLRELTEFDFVLNVQLSCGPSETKGDTVMCEMTETNDWLKTAGLREARYSATYVVTNGLIQSVRSQRTPETDQAIRRILDPLMKWASESKPELVAEMMPEQKFVYNAKNAKKSLSLLREWKEMARRKAMAPGWKKISD